MSDGKMLTKEIDCAKGCGGKTEVRHDLPLDEYKNAFCLPCLYKLTREGLKDMAVLTVKHMVAMSKLSPLYINSEKNKQNG